MTINCFTIIPEDVWLEVIGPELSARDIVSLSMVCRWARHMAHQITNQRWVFSFEDKSPNLCHLRHVVECWPSLNFKFLFNDDKEITNEQFVSNLSILGRTSVLWLFYCRPITDFGFIDAKKLTQLWLYDTYLSCNACQSLCNSILSGCSVSFMVLWDNHIENEGMGWIAKMLLHNQTIKTLWLHNQGCHAGRQFGPCLLQNKTLTTLQLEDEFLGQDSGEILAQALVSTKTLKSLVLRGNKLGVQGGFWLGEALMTNTSLTSLTLFNNELQDEGAEHILEALKTNKHLRVLDLRWNNLGEKTSQNILKMFQINTTLTALDLKYNSVHDSSVLGTIRACLDRNQGALIHSPQDYFK
eukprot:c9262_g1_i5.p1 GENE.c9262_g1_i5~~c9262_g1_i5.p1  ORF type:complete len:409 (-),score=85.00 c9262_g1_i5:93-1160(-)